MAGLADLGWRAAVAAYHSFSLFKVQSSEFKVQSPKSGERVAQLSTFNFQLSTPHPSLGRRLAVVSRHVGSRHRPGASWPTGDGGPLHVSAVDWADDHGVGAGGNFKLQTSNFKKTSNLKPQSSGTGSGLEVWSFLEF